MSYLTEHETVIRISVFAVMLFTMIFLEVLLPRKQRSLPRCRRWITNLSLVVIDSILLRFLLPVLAMGMAILAAEQNWGLFNLVSWPPWLEILVSIILLDMLIYWQHVIMHHVPLLWLMHKVHHSDRDFDVTTGVRFHPLEIVLSMLYKLLCVVLIGPQLLAVFIFEIVLNACAMFNHANIALPPGLDRLIRVLLVTPDMHRVHHSSSPTETNSNYGFSLSIWDFVFRTYQAQPAIGHDDMVIGLDDHQTQHPASLMWCLLLPLRGFVKNRKENRSCN